MRIIHTADWHLCDRLGRLDRTDDLKARVECVAKLCEEHTADVLLIAGDLFSEQAQIDDMTRALNHIRDTFKSFFARGGTILAITGNHDRDGRINMVRAGMSLAAPDAGAGGAIAGGRMYLINGRATAKLSTRDGRTVQFVLVPYPFASRYDLSATDYRSREEETRLLRTKVCEWLEVAAAKLDPTLPTVLAAHLHVRGSELHSLHRITERDDVLFDFGDLRTNLAYVALGHIHKPQCLGGAEHVRYPGSLDLLDFGESHEPGVLLLEIDGAKPVVPVRLPIPATPFRTITLTDPEAELPSLTADATAIVRIHVAPPLGGTSRDEIVRQLRKLFPRWHEIKWTDAAQPREAAPGAFTVGRGFETTVRDFLAKSLATDPDKDAVLALAESFLAAGGDA